MKTLALLIAFAALAFADGEPVLLHQQSGPFLITVFGTPQAGPTGFTVLVQNASDRSPILDAAVEIHIGNSTTRATHEQATNKLLYAASIHFFDPGRQPIEVTVSRNGQSASIHADIAVAPAPAPWLAWWPYFALVPAAVLLFALNQWLKAKRKRRV